MARFYYLKCHSLGLQAEWWSKRSFPHKGDLGFISNSRGRLRWFLFFTLLGTSNNKQKALRAQLTIVIVGTNSLQVYKKNKKNKQQRFFLIFKFNSIKWNIIKVTGELLMAKSWTRDHGFNWSPSLINMVVIKHRRQVKIMQTHKMSLVWINMGITSKHKASY
jgi:hypothetical protein